MKAMSTIQTLAAPSEIIWFPCGAGQMPARHWPKPGAEQVVLLHGGSGSWLHFIRNIEALHRHFDLYALDLPGLGDAAMCPVESDAASAAAETLNALTACFDEPFHLVAFSWGCTVAAMLMKQLAGRLKSVMFVGPAAVGELPRNPVMKPLIKRNPEMTRDEVLAVQRQNLARLMIHEPAKIDELAVLVQDLNTSRARFSSPQYARTTLLIDGVRATETPFYVIYGDQDAPALPELEARRTVFMEARPDVRFELVEGAGHWLQYEEAELFNRRCTDWLVNNS